MNQLQLLRLLLALVETAGDSITGYASSFFSIIRYELTEAGTDARDLFLEDGLVLWNHLIHLSNISYSPEIHSLFTILIYNYSRNMKLFTTVMGLIDGYLCLGKQTFLQDYKRALSSIYQTLLNLVSSREMRRLATSIHILLLLFPDEGVEVMTGSIDNLVYILTEIETHQSTEKYEFSLSII